MNSSLKNEMKSSGVPSELINAMPPPEVEKNGNSISVKAGYKKGTYDPENLSDGYKVVMLNYGTPNRQKHGKIHEGSTTKAGMLKLGFIARGKNKARPKIKKAQEEVLNKILARLK